MLKVTRKLKVTSLTVSDYIADVNEIKNIKMKKVDEKDFIIPYNSVVITEYFNLVQTNELCNELFFHENFMKIQLQSLKNINQQYVEIKKHMKVKNQYMLHTYSEHGYYFKQIFDKYQRLGDALGFHISK